jgi:hypothetical protein
MKRILSIFLLSIVLMFPGDAVTTIQWANNATSLTTTRLKVGTTSVTVTTGEGDKFPAVASPHYFMITLVDVSGNREIVKVTARSAGSNTMTIVRAQEGTSARVFEIGSYVDQRITAGSLDEFSNVVDYFAGYYVCDASALDQADTVNSNSLASLTGDIGTSRNATIVLPHSGTGSTTAYNVLQNLDLSSYDNITYVVERGAIITHAANTIDMSLPQAGLYQVFSGTGAVTFNQANNGGVVRPQLFGAAADGVTDDDVAIQNALDSATVGIPVYFPAGTYLFDTTLNPPEKCIIKGAGEGVTTLKRKAAATGDAIQSTADADDIILRDFTLDCNSTGTDGIDLGNGTGTWGAGGYIENVDIINCSGDIYDLNIADSAIVKKDVCFSVYLNAAQSLAHNSLLIVEFDQEEFDTNSDFNTTLHEFLPTIPGKYILSANLTFDSGSADQKNYGLEIFKNGASVKEHWQQTSGTGTQSLTITAIVDANGFSDDFRIYAYQDTGGALDIVGTTSYTCFYGSKVN